MVKCTKLYGIGLFVEKYSWVVRSSVVLVTSAELSEIQWLLLVRENQV